MKTLLILRHAKSSWKHSEISDHERSLNSRGQSAAPRMGQLLYEENLVPDVILSSTARRASETVDLVAEACGFSGEIVYSSDLYPGWPSDYLDLLRGLADEIESEHLPTAAIAYIRLPITSWRDLTDEIEGELLGLWRPRTLEN
jgi:phosphohistidine phosphatase